MHPRARMMSGPRRANESPASSVAAELYVIMLAWCALPTLCIVGYVLAQLWAG